MNNDTRHDRTEALERLREKFREEGEEGLDTAYESAAAELSRLQAEVARLVDPERPRPDDVGHGHVIPRPDGVRARCGGPRLCRECSRDLARQRATDASDRQCAWADYRKDYGVGEPEMVAAHKAFMAGWKAAREGDQSGPLR